MMHALLVFALLQVSQVDQRSKESAPSHHKISLKEKLVISDHVASKKQGMVPGAFAIPALLKDTPQLAALRKVWEHLPAFSASAGTGVATTFASGIVTAILTRPVVPFLAALGAPGRIVRFTINLFPLVLGVTTSMGTYPIYKKLFETKTPVDQIKDPARAAAIGLCGPGLKTIDLVCQKPD